MEILNLQLPATFLVPRKERLWKMRQMEKQVVQVPQEIALLYQEGRSLESGGHYVRAEGPQETSLQSVLSLRQDSLRVQMDGAESEGEVPEQELQEKHARQVRLQVQHG